MTMTKADIVERIYEKVGFSKKEATEVVESIFELVKERLEQGEKVKISGFGNFVVNEKRPRKGRNPQTGEEIVISGRRRRGYGGGGARRARGALSDAGGMIDSGAPCGARAASPRCAPPMAPDPVARARQSRARLPPLAR